MDCLPHEILGMILDALKPSSLFIWADQLDSGHRRSTRDIKSMRICSRKLAEVAARHSVPGDMALPTLKKLHRILPRLSGYARGFSFMDDGLDTFYEEKAELFLITKDQRRKSNIERFMNSVFASFENLSAMRIGDSAAFISPRRSSRCQPKYFGNGIYTATDGDVIFRSITRAGSNFYELQLGSSLPTGKLSFDGMKHLRLNPFVGNLSAGLLAQCPNLDSLCITGDSIRDREFCFYDRLGNDLCGIYRSQLKTLSLSQLTVGADEIVESLRRHKLTLVEVSLWKLAFLTGSLFQLFSDLHETNPRPAVDAADLVVQPRFHLFPAEKGLHRELLDTFFHMDPPQDLHPAQSQLLTAESILKASHPHLRPRLEKELKANLYRRKHGSLLSVKALAQIRQLATLIKSWERVAEDLYEYSENFGDDDGDT